MKHKDPEVRKKATTALNIIVTYREKFGKITVSAESIVEALIWALKDKERDVRVEAVTALGEVRDARAVEPLINTVSDKSESTDIRYAAVTALVNTAHEVGPAAKAAVPVLAEMLGTVENETMRVGVVVAFAKIGPDAKSAVPALTRALGGDSSMIVRKVSAEALAQIGPDAKSAVPALTRALEDSSLIVREASAEALAKIGVDEEATMDAVMELMRDSAGYFECDVPSGDGVCSDNNCPCPEVKIPRGTGYLYITQELVDFRRKYPSISSAREAMQQLQESMRASGELFFGSYRLGPIVVCEQGARLRNLDLKIAGADAKYWWETSKVPLRVTPLEKK
ncbi:HEAT repeat domain-containing protein [Chloroflexota bacterium]